MSIQVDLYTTESLDGEREPATDDILRHGWNVVRQACADESWAEPKRRISEEAFRLSDNHYAYAIDPPVVHDHEPSTPLVLKEWGEDLEDDIYRMSDLQEFESCLHHPPQHHTPTFFTGSSSISDRLPQPPRADAASHSDTSLFLPHEWRRSTPLSTHSAHPPPPNWPQRISSSFPEVSMSTPSVTMPLPLSLQELLRNQTSGAERTSGELLDGEAGAREGVALEGHTLDVDVHNADVELVPSEEPLVRPSAQEPAASEDKGVLLHEPQPASWTDDLSPDALLDGLGDYVGDGFSVTSSMRDDAEWASGRDIEMTEDEDEDTDEDEDVDEDVEVQVECEEIEVEDEDEDMDDLPFLPPFLHGQARDSSRPEAITVQDVFTADIPMGEDQGTVSPNVTFVAEPHQPAEFELPRDEEPAEDEPETCTTRVEGPQQAAPPSVSSFAPAAEDVSKERVVLGPASPLVVPTERPYRSEPEPSLYDVIPQPHFYVVPIEPADMDPLTVDLSAQLASLHHLPTPIPPYTDLTLPTALSRPYARSAWIIPVRGSPPWPGCTPATVTFSPTPAPTPTHDTDTDPCAEHITWTPPTLLALWSHLLSLRDKATFGPIGLSFHIARRRNKHPTPVPSLLGMDHVKLYVESTHAREVRLVLAQWTYEVPPSSRDPPHGASGGRRSASEEWDFDEGAAIDLDPGDEDESEEIPGLTHLLPTPTPSVSPRGTASERRCMLKEPRLVLVDERNRGICIC